MTLDRKNDWFQIFLSRDLAMNSFTQIYACLTDIYQQDEMNKRVL